MRYVFSILCFLIALPALAIDSTVTALTAATSASTDDVLYIVDDPGGSPASKKITFDNAQKSLTKVSTALSTGFLKVTTTTGALSSVGLTDAFGPLDNEPPTSNYCTLSTRNGHPVCQFDTTTQETFITTRTVPDSATVAAGATVYVTWTAASATSGTIGWDVTLERVYDAGNDIDSDAWGTAKTITAATVDATSGKPSTTSVAFASGDFPASLAAGETYRIRIRRDVSNDDATGDAELIRARVVWR